MTSRVWWSRLPGMAVAVGCLLVGGEAAAAVFTVNSTFDQIDVDPGNGVCADVTGKCTLRAAIQEANATDAADTVNLRAGLYRLAIHGVDKGDEAGDLNIRHSLKILGAGANVTIVDGSGLDRLFNIGIDPSEQGEVSFSNLTIQNGRQFVGGGLVSSGATFSMKSSNILRNRATEGGGGMFFSSGNVVLVGCKIRNNIASGTNEVRGGGITTGSQVSSVVLSGCDVSNNSAISTRYYAAGGGMSMWSNRLVITGGRVSDNVVSGREIVWGGGLEGGVDELTINGTTISGNHVACFGGNCRSEGGGAIIGGRIISFRGTVAENMVSGENGCCGGLNLNGTEACRITSSTIKNNQVVASLTGSAGGISATGVQITSSSITGNSVSGSSAQAGGLFLASEATLTKVVVSNNSLRGSVYAYGGGILSEGHLTLNATSVESNTAVSSNGFGGGISSGGAFPHDLDIMRASRIRFNFASSSGGGIFQDTTVASTITKSADSAVSGNLPDNVTPPLP